jgi:hypothetical protein
VAVKKAITMSSDVLVACTLGLTTWAYLCYRTWREQFEPEGVPDDWAPGWQGLTVEELSAEGNIPENKT